jgi:RHS repeat-associated protein
LGTPTQMYDTNGEKTWDAVLDIYGSVRTFAGRSLSECPFRYQGQYQDEETGLYYNRFRYYDAEVGSYISQDPIGGR